ncbi:hypothetical protein COY52_01795 [Candidatus Desantisbacteria bacterium CG_4_10_14_0_8_um_filter_48_22]|uniref:Trimethylamine corrinoid protein 2 n=1 Tax=Candidatus Desantisbacteria bacterium CG_4_10_14_0_8_um_filter_48_22 TaxID=1974543 RepID=A0A2M7SEL4_9BACT|nr:MAG: hypothetical protein AUJ67_07545 [Candidatus Desantisbacteria bacterium CG1_02_49_89]PIV57214.1 MAG: hypothetical protein COS16_01495 [Candidatus Desantisbacteria bacterium CG02_land_8_20_14_3_00_49_13]PIZ17977.1 MAG: hypothetical protein COY52_01795 [Candidatus Desantisbacteria bacterium CG_4_10_14_0_8_um_filter_48_22]
MSALKYKKDWEEAKEHYRAWWKGEYFGRCAISVTAPLEKAGKEPPPAEPQDPVVKWSDPGYIREWNEYALSRTFFGGEAFPIWHGEGGHPGHADIPTFLGCPLTLDLHTGWHEPVLTGDDWDIHKLRIDPEGRWWKFTLDALGRGAMDAKGKAISCIGAFGGTGDTLSSLRGADRLLYDLCDCPEKVLDAELFLMDTWIHVYKKFYGIIKGSSDNGSTCWFDLWAPGKFYAVQNDLSYMISTDMFERIFIPALEKQLEFLDYAIYHVDGIGAFKHVPMLCGLKRLKALQILPGAGKPSPLYYMDVLKTVQSRGKNLHISIAPNEVEEALKNLSAKGLFIATWCASEQEAKDLLEKVKEWSKIR